LYRKENLGRVASDRSVSGPKSPQQSACNTLPGLPMKTCTRGNHGMLILAQARSGLIPIARKSLHAAGSCEAFLCARVWRAWTQAARPEIGRLFGAALIFQLVLLFAVSHSASAEAQTRQGVVNTQKTEVVVSQAKTTAELATQWGLTQAQWQRYQKVMQEKRGVWSPGLDPLTALGVSADTPTQRREFAELYVRAEFERVRKELAFQVEVDEAWKRLYPDTPRLLDVARSKADTKPTHRYAVVVSPDCTSCEQVVMERLKWLETSISDEPVDVHVVGTLGDDTKLRAWVKENRWIEQALKSKRATLNHGDQFAGLSQFPVVYAKKEGGAWAREL